MKASAKACLVAGSVALVTMFVVMSGHGTHPSTMDGQTARVLRRCGDDSPASFDRANCKAYCGPSKLPKQFRKTVPPSAYRDSLQCFVLFLGHSRSGSSITGAAIDAHPRTMLAHEYFLTRRMTASPEKYTDKAFFVSELVNYHQWKLNAQTGVGSDKKGYSLIINNSLQGHYTDDMSVLGDKAAASSVALYRSDPDRFANTIATIQDTMEVPVKFIEVVRNPFDIIATAYIYGVGGADLRSELSSAMHNVTLETEVTDLDCKVEHHVNTVKTIESLRETLSANYSIHLLYYENLIRQPEEELMRLCHFLGLNCSRHYIETCKAAIFPTTLESRHRIKWTPKQKSRIFNLINSTPYLKQAYNPKF